MLRKYVLILLCFNNNENYSLLGKKNLPDTAKYVDQGESENFPEHQQHLEETGLQSFHQFLSFELFMLDAGL